MRTLRKLLSGARAPTRLNLGIITVNGKWEWPLCWRYTSHTWSFWRWSRNSRTGQDRIRLAGRWHWRGQLAERNVKEEQK